MTLAAYILRNRVAVVGTTLGLTVAGAFAAARMPIGMFPEVAFSRIVLVAHSGNLPVEQTLTAVTQPLENALTTVLGVEKIRSRTARGGAEIDVHFAWGEDMQRALQRVQAAVEESRSSLPAATAIETRLLDTSAFPVFGVAVTSRTRSLAQLSDFVLYEAAPVLRTVPGVYRVDLNGAKIREYSITLDPEALLSRRLDLAMIESAVRQANTIAAGGPVRDGSQLTLAVTRGEATELRGLPNAIVAQNGSAAVKLADVAKVEESLREDFTRASANGETAVLLNVSRQPLASVVALSASLKKSLAELAAAHPDCQFSVFYDQADLVLKAITHVRDAMLVGLLLAVVTIGLFLGRLVETLVAAAVIPATVLISCVVLYTLGASFNLMTLGGIGAGIGLVLDDAIVVVESIHRHRMPRATKVAAAIAEIARPLIGSTLAPIAVLLPLALLGGVPGAFFRPLALTMCVTLLVSLLLALSFTPALAESMTGAPEQPRRDESRAWYHRWYRRALYSTLRHPLRALGLALALLASATFALRQLDTGFMPDMDEGAFVLDYWSPPGTSLEETITLLSAVDEILNQTPEVISFSRRTGAELGFFLTETNRGDYVVRLTSAPRRPIQDVVDDVRQRIRARLPGLRVEFMQILQDMVGDLSGDPNPLEVKVFGQDLPATMRTARSIHQLLSQIPGAVDAFDGITPVGSTLDVEVDELEAKRAGLNADQVQHWLETSITGVVVGQILDGDRAIPLRLRYPDRFRMNIDAVAALDIANGSGNAAPLRSIARLSSGPAAIERIREDLRPLLRVSARIQGDDLGSVMRALRRRIQTELSLPPGVALEYGGLYASQQRAFAELILVFVAAGTCLSLVLLVEFGSPAAVVAIVSCSLLSLAGSILALWLTATAVNLSSMVGMLMVVGIVAKNGILLLDATQREDEHQSLRESLLRAGEVRLRPILMTSLAAGAGLLPLAFGLGIGSQMLRPLALAILGGMSLSMLFSLGGIPLVYSLLARPRPRD